MPSLDCLHWQFGERGIRGSRKRGDDIGAAREWEMEEGGTECR